MKNSSICLCFFVHLLMSCGGMRVKLLKNNITEVPADSTVFKNKIKFDKTVFTVIDTTVMYKEVKVPESDNGGWFGIYKFYPNGNVNAFFTNQLDFPAKEFLDPEFAGLRGIYYLEAGVLHMELFGAIDQRRHLGKITSTIKVQGDYLYIQRDPVKGINRTNYFVETYKAQKLPAEYFTYKARW